MAHLAIKTDPSDQRAEIAAEHLEFAPVVRILAVALRTAPKTTDKFVWVTSGRDSHASGLHPKFRAFDFRTSNIMTSHGTIEERHTEGRRWAARMRDSLGNDYDVVYESDHIHVEYDPEHGG